MHISINDCDCQISGFNLGYNVVVNYIWLIVIMRRTIAMLNMLPVIHNKDYTVIHVQQTYQVYAKANCALLRSRRTESHIGWNMAMPMLFKLTWYFTQQRVYPSQYPLTWYGSGYGAGLGNLWKDSSPFRDMNKCDNKVCNDVNMPHDEKMRNNVNGES